MRPIKCVSLDRKLRSFATKAFGYGRYHQIVDQVCWELTKAAEKGLPEVVIDLPPDAIGRFGERLLIDIVSFGFSATVELVDGELVLVIDIFSVPRYI